MTNEGGVSLAAAPICRRDGYAPGPHPARLDWRASIDVRYYSTKFRSACDVPTGTSQACPDMNEAANKGDLRDDRCAGCCRAMPDHSATPRISDRYKRPLQVSRYLRQFPSPRSPNASLLRQAYLNSAHTSLRTGLWQVSRYLRQFPSPRSPSASLFSQARRNCSHCPPPRPSYTRTPPGPTSMDWEKAEIGITKRAAAAAAPNA
jgi:hypothetical protein